MIEKKTIIDQIEIARDGTVQVRLALLMLEDGVEIASQWHRTSIEPGGDVDAILTVVEDDITTRPSLKARALDREKVPLLKSVCKLAHTPDIVAKHKAAVLAAQRDFEEKLNAKPV